MGIFGQLLKNETPDEATAPDSRDQTIQKLSAILNTLSSGVFAVEPDGRVFFWGKTISQMTGVPKEIALGKNYYTIIKLADKNHNHVTSPIFEVLEKRQTISLEYEAVLGDKGSATLILATYVPLFNENEKVIGITVEIKDISEEKKLEQMKLDFVSIVSHELRRPITSIKGYLDVLLKEAAELTPEHREFAQRAFFSNERELEIIEALLNASKIEQGTINIKIETLRLEDIISSVVTEWQESAQGKKLELKFIYPHFTLPNVLADRGRLRDVLTNLISNALKYTHQGSIVLTVTQKGKELITSIEDSGLGIPEELKPKLFQKFYRGERSLTEETPGTGLGLYITKSFIEMMQGRIWYESKVDRGSTFYFSLPISQ